MVPGHLQTKPFSDLPAYSFMERFLERALPGQSTSIRRMREQVIEFAVSPTAKSVLLRGPIGAGKSTLARTIGLMKRVAPLSAEIGRNILENIRFDGPNQIDFRSILTWYTELPLTGLVESLAEAQLFGTDTGAFTGATKSPGIFEKASTGNMPKGKEPSAAQLTGGIVFLDEIGELTPRLQAKLLPILSGGVYYRLGTEGRADADLHFRGVTIAASWRRLDGGILRPDLLSRIAGYTIDVPGLDERMEDFDALLAVVQDILIEAVRSEIRRMQVVEPNIDRAYWSEREKLFKPLNKEARRLLAQVSWGRHGNLRGLATAVEKILVTGRSIEQVIAELPILDNSDSDAAPELLDALLKATATGGGLAAHVRTFELDQRRRLRADLLSNPASLSRVAATLEIDEHRLKSQLRQIDRERQNKRDRQ